MGKEGEGIGHLTLLEVMARLPDPRSGHGRRHPLGAILGMAACAMRSQSSRLVMSPWKTDASPPSDLMISSVSSARDSTWSTSRTLAPSRAIRIAAALPLPIPSPLDPAPVMIATLPSSPGRSLCHGMLSC